MPDPSRQDVQEVLQPCAVKLPAGRQLVEHGAQMTSKGPGAAEEALDRLLRVLELLHVREKAAGFYGEQESARRARGPVSERVFFRQPVETVVDFNGVEDGGVVLEPPLLRKVSRVEVPAPVFVLPPGTADAGAARLGHRRARRKRRATNKGDRDRDSCLRRV